MTSEKMIQWRVNQLSGQYKVSKQYATKDKRPMAFRGWDPKTSQEIVIDGLHQDNSRLWKVYVHTVWDGAVLDYVKGFDSLEQLDATVCRLVAQWGSYRCRGDV